MKGITPVIAVILLIMITISMVGFLFVWFSGYMPLILNQTESQLTEQQRQMQMGVNFIDAYEDSVTGNIFVSLRNSGTVTIRANELVIVVRNATTTVGTYTYPSAIAPAGTVLNQDTGISCEPAGNVEVKADIPGTNDDIVSIICT